MDDQWIFYAIYVSLESQRWRAPLTCGKKQRKSGLVCWGRNSEDCQGDCYLQTGQDRNIQNKINMLLYEAAIEL